MGVPGQAGGPNGQAQTQSVEPEVEDTLYRSGSWDGTIAVPGCPQVPTTATTKTSAERPATSAK